MGIRGLQTFLESYSPDMCYRVDISKLVKDHKTKTGKKAKIVVDAQSCYQVWYGDLDWLAGYEVQEYIIRLRAFVESFKKLNVELIFFFGGSCPEKKRKTWLVRRRQNIDDIHKGIDSLVTFQRLPDRFQWILANPGLTTAYILKYVLGCKVCMTIDECDEEVIKYAQKHDCFAIFGQDTDFVISQVDAIVLSSKHFKIENMTTLLYDRVNLARRLGIRTEELPLLAILAGNDLISVDEVKGFQRRICPCSGYRIPFELLMPAIARYINQLPKNLPIERTLELLAKDLFNDTSRAQLLKTSYNSYFVAKNSVILTSADANKWSKILRVASDNYQKTILPPHAYFVLSEQTFEGGTAFEDLRNNRSCSVFTRDQPSCTVLRPLRLRLYGILLSEKEDKNSTVPVTVREWCNENEKSYHEPVVVRPIKPKVQHPGLIALWSDNDDINEVRWTLFLATISPSLKAAQWQSFNKGLLFTTLSVYHLYEIKYINESELDAILVTIATYPQYAGKLSTLRYGKLNFRAADISITLNRTFGLVLTVLAACGYPVKLSKDNVYLKFEGKLFQIMHTYVVKEKADIGYFCENNGNCFKLFKRMKNMITGTVNDHVRRRV